MAQLFVDIVSPERELWSGEAHLVVARTTDGDIGVMPNHVPVLGTFGDGSYVRVMDESNEELVHAAVHNGFLSVADNRVSILAEEAELGGEIDVSATRTALDRARGADSDDEDAKAEVSRLESQLRAAGEEV